MRREKKYKDAQEAETLRESLLSGGSFSFLAPTSPPARAGGQNVTFGLFLGGRGTAAAITHTDEVNAHK